MPPGTSASSAQSASIETAAQRKSSAMAIREAFRLACDGATGRDAIVVALTRASDEPRSRRTR